MILSKNKDIDNATKKCLQCTDDWMGGDDDEKW